MKNKGILFGIIGVAAAVLAGTIFGGYILTGGGRRNFPADGYILGVVEEEDIQRVAPISFSTDTIYRKKFPDSYVFKDIQGKTNTVSAENFIHYNDGSLSAFSDGAAVNMQEVTEGFLEFYRIGESMVMHKAADGWEIDNNGNAMPFPELLWQISEDRILLASDEMTLSLKGREPEKLSGALEAVWLDKGIIRVTDKENVRQVVATDGRLTFQSGAVFDFAQGVLFDAGGKTAFTLEELYADTEQGIAIRAGKKNNWKPPVYEIKTQDGKDGTDGKPGETGKTGEAGKPGEKGDDGTSGTAAAAGVNGAAGAAGKKGETGKKGVGDEEDEEEETGLGTITLQEVQYSSLSVNKIIMNVNDPGGTLTHQNAAGGTIEIRDAKTKNLIKSAPFTIGDAPTDPSEAWTITWAENDFQNILRPDREYTLVVKKGFVINITNEDGTTDAKDGTKTFIRRDFFTDASGVAANVEKIEEKGIYVKFNSLQAAAGAERPESYMLRIISGDKWAVFPETSGGAAAPSPLDYTESVYVPIAELLAKRYRNYTEISNIPYTIELYLGKQGTWTLNADGVPNLSTGMVNKSGRVLTGVTLKRQPVIGSVGAVQADGYYDLSVSVGSDYDKSVQSYRFTVIQDDRILKVMDVAVNYAKWYYESAANNGIPCRITCEVTYFDNEKENRVSAQEAYPVYVRGAGVNSNIRFIPYEQVSGNWVNKETNKNVTDTDAGTSVEGQVRIWGDIRLELRSEAGVMRDKPLRVAIRDTSPGAPAESGKTFIWYIPYEDRNKSVFYIPVKSLEVKEGADYMLSVFGRQSGLTPEGDEICLGTYEIKNLH